MKYRRSEVQKKAHALPELRFEDQTLTSFAGLVLFQKFFARIDLKRQLRRCFEPRRARKVFHPGTIFLQLIVHLLLGFRELQDLCYYRDDPLVQRLLGLPRLPTVATVSRVLKQAQPATVENLRRFLRTRVLDGLHTFQPVRVTLDFDGSVQSTQRWAEGTAVGFNKKKKGARSYYPLFCTGAQTGQVLDVLHRPGNVHDSQGAPAFILACIAAVRVVLPHAVIEVRMDSAFFSEEIVSTLDHQGVEFAISVPFERFVELKRMIESRQRWHRVDDQTSSFEAAWKPQCWDRRFRFVFIRTRAKKQQKGPIQLDLFVPYEYGYEFKVIVTNKTLRAQGIAAFHEGRGSQEGVLGELKSHCHLDYVPVRTLCGNQLYLLAGLFAYHLTRELQMQTTSPVRGTTAQRCCLWVFTKVGTFRKTLLRRAGRLSRPQGVLTLTLSANSRVKTRLLQILDRISAKA